METGTPDTAPLAVAPVPPRTGPLGHFRGLSRDPLGYIHTMARTYGDVVHFTVGSTQIYLVNRPDLIETMLVTENRKFVKPRLLHLASETLGNGLLTSEGSFWLRQRRLAAPAFHREKIRGYAVTMVDEAERMVAGWNDGETRDIHREMMRVTLEIVSRTLFGTDIPPEQMDEVEKILDVALNRFRDYQTLRYQLFDWFPRPLKLRFRAAGARLDRIIYNLIAARRALNLSPADDPTLLGTYLAARDDDGGGMTDRQLRDECVTIFLAGHETTANALTFALYLLSVNPEKREKLEAELDALPPDRPPTADDLPRLPYTRQVVNEAMRLYPPAWRVGREATEDVRLGEYAVPAGSQLFACQWTIHRDPRWYAEPEKFIPERWTDEFERSLPRYAYFPFGGGPRLCIGSSFAEMEAALLLAVICRRHRFEYLGDSPPELYPSITLRPLHGMEMRVESRNRL